MFERRLHTLEITAEVGIETLRFLHVLPRILVVLLDLALVFVCEERRVLLDVIALMPQHLGDGDGIREGVRSVEAHLEERLEVLISHIACGKTE